MFIRLTEVQKDSGDNVYPFPASSAQLAPFDGTLSGFLTRAALARRGAFVSAPVKAPKHSPIPSRFLRYKNVTPRGLGYYDGLSGFSLKKAVKKVSSVAKKVVDVHKIAVASVASSVGIKKPAQKILGLSDKQMRLANKLGTVEKVAAGAVIGVAAAPAIGGALTAAGHAVTTGAGGALTALKASKLGVGAKYLAGKVGVPNLVKTVGGLFSKAKGGGESAAAPDSSGAEGALSPEKLKRLASRAEQYLSPQDTTSPATPSIPGGGGPGASYSDSSEAPAVTEASAAGSFGGINPTLMIAGAGASILYFLHSRKGKKRGRR